MNPSILPLVLSAACALLGAAIAFGRRNAPGSRAAGSLMLALAWWSLFAAIGRASPTLATKLFWARWEYVGIAACPLLWTLFTLRVAGLARWLTARRLAAICVLPATLLLLVWTNAFHGQVWSHASIGDDGGYATLRLVYGPAGWLSAFYGWGCLMLGTLTIASTCGASPGLNRHQTLVLLACAAAPCVADAAYLAGIGPSIDLTPVGFTISGLGAVWVLQRFHLLELVPVACPPRSGAMERAAESLRPGTN